MLIDEFSEGVLDELDALASAAGANAIYILIDGAFVPGLHQHFKAELGEQSVRLLFGSLPSVTEEVLDVSPFVFQYCPGNAVIRRLLRKCSGFPMLSVIESPEAFVTLAERLSAWTIVASDGARFNFRFADTRRLPAILRVLNEDQLGAIAGAAFTWRYVDRTGNWTVTSLPGTSAAIQPRPQTLNSEQFAILVDDAESDVLLASLKQAAYPFEGTLSEHYRCVAIVFEAACACGLNSDQTYGLFRADGQRITDVSSATAMAIQLKNQAGFSKHREVMHD